MTIYTVIITLVRLISQMYILVLNKTHLGAEVMPDPQMFDSLAPILGIVTYGYNQYVLLL